VRYYANAIAPLLAGVAAADAAAGGGSSDTAHTAGVPVA
jgi:hypothetical protein